MGQEKEFARVCKTLNTDDKEILQFMLAHLNRTVFEQTYAKVLKNYTKSQLSQQHYAILRKYLSSDERLVFAQDILKKSQEVFNGFHYRVFYIQLLAQERRLEEILTFIQEQTHDEKIEELIAPIVDSYPEESYTLITTQTLWLIQKRSKKDYAQACKLLKLLPMNKKLKEYIQGIATKNQRLRALQNELIKAKLI